MTPKESNDFYERDLQRRPDIHFITTDQAMIARVQKHCAAFAPMEVNLPEWHGDAYVIRWTLKRFDEVHVECEVVFRPTGAPRLSPLEQLINRDYPKFGDGPTIKIHPPKKYSVLQEVADSILQGMKKKQLRPVMLRCPTSTVEASLMGVDWSKDAFAMAMKPLVKEKPVKIRNKYYVAAPSVSTPSEQDQDNLPGKVAFADPKFFGSRSSGKWTRKDLNGAV